jgi:hypothetical protein
MGTVYDVVGRTFCLEEMEEGGELGVRMIDTSWEASGAVFADSVVGEAIEVVFQFLGKTLLNESSRCGVEVLSPDNDEPGRSLKYTSG